MFEIRQTVSDAGDDCWKRSSMPSTHAHRTSEKKEPPRLKPLQTGPSSAGFPTRNRKTDVAIEALISGMDPASHICSCSRFGFLIIIK